ncbi:MAG: cyclic nucleotide-binding domain-containing protein [Acidimicrobiia bacterium]
MPLLSGLTQRELAVVGRLTTPVDVPAGTVLAEEGAVGAEFFIVLDGRVDVVQGDEVIATRGAGSHLGEIALLADRPRTATLVTTTPVRTVVASRREFASLLVEVPSLSDRLATTMAERLAA